MMLRKVCPNGTISEATAETKDDILTDTRNLPFRV